MNFKDYFSKQATDYALYRPHYPKALFDYLNSIVNEHKRVWDCGTGSGQVAVGLSPYFDEVIATDPSQRQIDEAIRDSKITYKVAAEDVELDSHSIDLVTVGQALHWFDFNKFYSRVKEVLKPKGVLAVWCYSLIQINPTLNSLVKHYYASIVGPFWPAERHWVEEQYEKIPFPWDEMEPPEMNMTIEWTLKELLGYLNTWSATQRFIDAHGDHPLDQIIEDLKKAWGRPDEKKAVHWPLHLRVGRLKA
ncbi:MAG TPA: class I SAM-dependent methyltransferase [Spirochaetes bacterium]|nr:class I SAM-dependent methyltransferase [Spirochaetota bacterium]